MKTLSMHMGLLIISSILLQTGCAHLTGVENNIEIAADDLSESKISSIENPSAGKADMLKAQSSLNNPIKNGEVIFISDSQACHCTLEKCSLIREKLKSILENKKYRDVIKIDEIDYAVDLQKAEEIYEQYKLWGIPSVVLKDKLGKILYLSSYEFNETAFKEKIEFIINDSPIEKGQ